MLVCEQCGCSGELGMGWVTVVRADIEEGEAWTGEYCPPCAAATLGRGSEAATGYVCVWEPSDASAVSDGHVAV